MVCACLKSIDTLLNNVEIFNIKNFNIISSIHNRNINEFLFIKLAPKKVRPEPFISPQLRAPNCGGGGQTDYNCCKSNNPCSEGMGDCDFDSDCFGGLKCGTNNCWTQFRVQNGYNWDIQADCCYGKRFHKRQKEKRRLMQIFKLISISNFCNFRSSQA